MRKNRKIRLKCDVFGIGSGVGQAVSGVAQAGGNVAAAMIAKNASEYAADQSLQGQREANQTNIDIMRETNAANLQLAQQQNQWNLEQWNRQNEYNSPANQMKLYKQAGLNPNLAQGNFSPAQELQSANLANQVPTTIQNPAAEASAIRAQGALTSAEYLKNAVGDAVQIARGVSEIRKIGKDTQLTESQVVKTNKEIESLTLQNDWYDKLSASELSLRLNQVEEIKNNIGLIKENRRKVRIDANMQKFELGVKKRCQDIILKMPQAQLDLLVAQIAASKAGANLDLSQAKINKLISDTGTQLPTVKSPTDQLLWDFYYYVTDNGKKNFIEVIVQGLSGKAEKIVKDKVKSAVKSIPKKVAHGHGQYGSQTPVTSSAFSPAGIHP